MVTPTDVGIISVSRGQEEDGAQLELAELQKWLSQEKLGDCGIIRLPRSSFALLHQSIMLIVTRISADLSLPQLLPLFCPIKRVIVGALSRLRATAASDMDKDQHSEREGGNAAHTGLLSAPDLSSQRSGFVTCDVSHVVTSTAQRRSAGLIHHKTFLPQHAPQLQWPRMCLCLRPTEAAPRSPPAADGAACTGTERWSGL